MTRSSRESKNRAACGAGFAGPAGTNRDLKWRVTMLREQTTRSKFAARQANGSYRFIFRWRISNPVLIATKAMVGLTA
jgi:hypothetical protein